MARTAARRIHRVEPPNAFLGRDAVFWAEPARPLWIDTWDASLARLPVAPLAVDAPAAARLSGKWVAAIAVSVVLHLAITAWFLAGGSDDAALTEGGRQIAAVQLGDGDADAAAAGASAEIEAISVTMVSAIAPEPAKTVEAPSPVEPDAVQPAPDTAIEPELPLRLDGVPTQLTAPVRPIPAPEVLATAAPEMVDDTETVQPVEEVEAAKPRQPDADQRREETKSAEAEKRRAEQARERKQKAAAAKKKAEDERKERAAEAAERKAKPARTSGQNGASKANTRKGSADGDKAASGSNKGKSKAAVAGNAAVSNYPGKVRSRIARAAGKIPRSLRSRAKGDVVVSFTVTANGGLGSVSVARSSGLAALDSAAIAAVRRAAPFPAIPDGAGRSSWQFAIPMGLGR